jgi:hypothetical protein
VEEAVLRRGEEERPENTKVTYQDLRALEVTAILAWRAMPARMTNQDVLQRTAPEKDTRDRTRAHESRNRPS